MFHQYIKHITREL